MSRTTRPCPRWRLIGDRDFFPAQDLLRPPLSEKSIGISSRREIRHSCRRKTRPLTGRSRSRSIHGARIRPQLASSPFMAVLTRLEFAMARAARTAARFVFRSRDVDLNEFSSLPSPSFHDQSSRGVTSILLKGCIEDLVVRPPGFHERRRARFPLARTRPCHWCLCLRRRKSC